MGLVLHVNHVTYQMHVLLKRRAIAVRHDKLLQVASRIPCVTLVS